MGMLVLSRRQGERIIIGNDIVITFLGLNDWNVAKLGIDAPKHIKIVREELEPWISTNSVDKPVGKLSDSPYRSDFLTSEDD